MGVQDVTVVNFKHLIFKIIGMCSTQVTAEKCNNVHTNFK